MLGSTETAKGVLSLAEAAGPPLPLFPLAAAVLTPKASAARVLRRMVDMPTL